MKWLHKLFNPHCPDCRLESIEAATCNSCETLRLELDRLRNENQQLLNSILNPTKEIEKVIDADNLIPIMPNRVPLSVKREQYEREDRLKAAQLRERAPKPDSLKIHPSALDVKKELEELNKLESDLKDAEQRRQA